MISDFREGGSFSKIGESLYKVFSIGGKSEIGGEGGSKMTQELDIIYGQPLT